MLIHASVHMRGVLFLKKKKKSRPLVEIIEITNFLFFEYFMLFIVECQMIISVWNGTYLAVDSFFCLFFVHILFFLILIIGILCDIVTWSTIATLTFYSTHSMQFIHAIRTLTFPISSSSVFIVQNFDNIKFCFPTHSITALCVRPEDSGIFISFWFQLQITHLNSILIKPILAGQGFNKMACFELKIGNINYSDYLSCQLNFQLCFDWFESVATKK